MVVRWGMQMALAAGMHKIVLESDNLSVVNILKHQYVGASNFFLIVEDIILLAKKLRFYCLVVC